MTITRETRDRWWLFAVALVIRAAYWIVAPHARASDSAEYLRAAKAVSAGQWSALREYPFHAVYALLLAPAFWKGEHVRVYVALLHVTLSAASVLWLWAIARQCSNDRVAPLFAGAIGAVYPNLLFWMPYILTETAFFFFLLAFTWSVIRVEGSSTRQIALAMVLGAVLFFVRPVALGVVVLGLTVVCIAGLRRYAPAYVGPAVVVGLTLIVLTVGMLSLSSASGRDRLFRIPTIGQTLWLSTTVVHGTQAEIAAAGTPPEAIDLPTADQYAYKARLAVRFIETYPGEYLLMAANRFVSFWAPWLYLDWSARHRLIDAALSLSLILASCCAPLLGARRRPWRIIMMFVFVLSLESAFGQIDADARYRLPAEVLLIVPASIALASLRHGMYPSPRRAEASA